MKTSNTIKTIKIRKIPKLLRNPCQSHKEECSIEMSKRRLLDAGAAKKQPKLFAIHSDSFFRARYRINSLKNWLDEQLSFERLDLDYDKAIIFMLACDYNNVGDVLIRMAQENFLKAHSNQKQIVVIDHNDTNRFLKNIRRNATENTIIVLTGGGNVDDRYIGTERLRNRIIKTMASKKCKIISFPQTIDYSKTNKGRFYTKLAQRAYASNENFSFVAREKISFNFAKSIFPHTNVLLTPDIVLSFKPAIPTKKRNGIGLLIRDDKEKNLDDEFLRAIISELEQKNYSISKSDMAVKDFDKKKIYDYARQKIAFAREKQLIITDRLHGMILCYITNTPCIVFQNSNHKISETFHNWLEKTQNFIILEEIQDNNKILEDIESLIETTKILKSDLSCNYNELMEILRQNNEQK